LPRIFEYIQQTSKDCALVLQRCAVLCFNFWSFKISLCFAFLSFSQIQIVRDHRISVHANQREHMFIYQVRNETRKTHTVNSIKAAHFTCRSSANQLCLMCWLIVVFCWFSVYLASKSKTWVIRYHYLIDQVRIFKDAAAQKKRGLFGFTRKIAPLEQ
jgi:hypothetical protein